MSAVFLIMSNDKHMKTCFSIFKNISILKSLLVTILSLVVGFMFISCNEMMSTWLLVTGFTAPVLFIFFLIIISLALPSFVQALEEGDGELIIFSFSFLPSFICTLIVVFSVIIFNIAWTVYGAVLFFPAATGPYPTCNDGEDGKVLVITGIIIVVLKIVFIFLPTIPTLTTRERFKQKKLDIDTTSITWRTRRFNNIEMGGAANNDMVNDVPLEAADNKLVAGLHALGLYLMLQ